MVGLSQVAHRQAGEFSKGMARRLGLAQALVNDPELLILDEPTGVLTPDEADHLFRILGTLRDQGKTVILITHKLREIIAITDHPCLEACLGGPLPHGLIKTGLVLLELIA